jgi:Spy/CpxP family protein refolding chaperone
MELGVSPAGGSIVLSMVSVRGRIHTGAKTPYSTETWSMKSLVHRLMFVGLAVAIALPMAAAQQEKEKKKGGGGGGPIAQLRQQLADVDLNAEQKKKIDDIIAEYEPKVAAARKKAGDALKMRDDARKKFKDEGRKGKDLNEAVKDAVSKLSPEQQKGLDEYDQVGRDLNNAVAAVLTDEQKAKAGLTKGKKKKAA